MSRVLFIVHDNLSHEPLGLEYVSASLLRAGHYTMACEESKALETIADFNPDFLGFQVLTGDQDHWGKVALSLKKKHPYIKNIFGGPHYLFFSQATQVGADIIIRGEAEDAIVAAVEDKEWRMMVVQEDMASVPFADRSLFYNNNFPGIKTNVIRNFIATRGCVYKCTYCYNSNESWQEMVGYGKSRIRTHSPQYVVEEIDKVFTNYGGKLVSFQDDIFGTDIKWLEEFTKEYQRLRIPFFAQFRPKFITEDRIKLMKEANVHIASFAIESGVEQTRKVILDRMESNEEIYKASQLLHKYDIKFRMQNLLALPVADPLQDALETLKFNMKCKPTLSWCSLLQAYPGTKIAEYVVKIGMVKSQEDLMPMINATFFDEGSLPIKDKHKIERLHKYWSAIVRWQWLYPVVRVLINFNLGHNLMKRIFEKSKQYINQQEYWRVKEHEPIKVNASQQLDRLGGELER